MFKKAVGKGEGGRGGSGQRVYTSVKLWHLPEI